MDEIIFRGFQVPHLKPQMANLRRIRLPLVPWICSKTFPYRPVRRIPKTAIFRSTSKSRLNNIRGGKNVRPYVRPSVRPQKVSSISMKFGIQVEVDE